MPNTNTPADTPREPTMDVRHSRHPEAGLNQLMPMIIPQPALCITFPSRGRSVLTAW
jgi:hypothetical protein